MIRIDAQHGLLPVDQPFTRHFHRAAHHGSCIHLAVTGLQTIQRAALDGELEILDFPVVTLEPVAQFGQLPRHLRHFLVQPVDGLWRADTGHHVLALGVHQVFAEQTVFTGARIAREGDPGGGIVAVIAEHHGADIHRRAIGHVRGNAELAPVIDRALSHP